MTQKDLYSGGICHNLKKSTFLSALAIVSFLTGCGNDAPTTSATTTGVLNWTLIDATTSSMYQHTPWYSPVSLAHAAGRAAGLNVSVSASAYSPTLAYFNSKL
jgi:hypothetical protein